MRSNLPPRLSLSLSLSVIFRAAPILFFGVASVRDEREARLGRDLYLRPLVRPVLRFEGFAGAGFVAAARKSSFFVLLPKRNLCAVITAAAAECPGKVRICNYLNIS